MFQVINKSILKRCLTTHTRTNGIIQTTILNKIKSEFKDSPCVEVTNMSHKHNVPKGAETHFEILVVSDKFNKMSHLQRNKLMNSLLKEEFKQVHSVSFRNRINGPKKARDSKTHHVPNFRPYKRKM